MDIVKHNQVAWDNQSNLGQSRWVQPVSTAEVTAARAGDWQVILTPTKAVPEDWFGDIQGKDLLGLASAGGQQIPLFAAAGARVTSFDNSPAQLAKDRFVAQRDGLDIAYEQGDMADLSRFADERFDLIFHPISNVFSEHVLPVWQHCARILRPGGRLLSGFMNPDFFLFDHDDLDQGGPIQVRFALPFADSSSSTRMTSWRAKPKVKRWSSPTVCKPKSAGNWMRGCCLPGFTKITGIPKQRR